MVFVHFFGGDYLLPGLIRVPRNGYLTACIVDQRYRCVIVHNNAPGAELSLDRYSLYVCLFVLVRVCHLRCLQEFSTSLMCT